MSISIGQNRTKSELVWAKLDHPRLNRRSYYNDPYNCSYQSNHGYEYPRYDSLNEPYGHRSALPGGIWHNSDQHYPLRKALPEYSSYNSNYYYDATPMAAAGSACSHYY
ncbi:unnamed protein product [Fraxinus pennsylvanica]|uniref:Uncharacterized protein n=1 Tax=Fraxinus pennsylvanica TaxID=56036 RepID=A0AAD1YWR6_9LAMI|nr:unnamed protein product [Fraxinus pennsylvanica]